MLGEGVGWVSLNFLLVDDHAILREGLKLILGAAFNGAVFGEAGTSSEALALTFSKNWDLVLLDLSMPGRGGLDVLKDLHVQHPSLPVLILSMHKEPQFAVRALKNGAKGYLTKTEAPTELIDAVKSVINGHHYLSSDLSGLLFQELGTTPAESFCDRLSDREFEILRLIASGKTVKEIAAEFCLSVNTISTYRARILEKMHMRNNAELMRYAFLNKLIN